MKRGIGVFLLFWVIVVACQPVQLTEEEKAWIASHPVIRLAPDPDFPPFEFFDQFGRYQGIGADMVQAFSRWSGLKIEIYRYSNWSQVLLALSNREIDMINCAIDTPSRRLYAIFPTPYLYIPNVVVTRKGMSQGLPFESVLRANTGMVRGYGMVDILMEKYPFFQPRLYSTITDGLRALVIGEIDYFLSDLATTSYYIVEGGFYSLQIVDSFEPLNISGFGVRSDWPVLVEIIEKFQKAFSSHQKHAILRRWIVAGSEYIFPKTPTWAYWVIGVLVVIGIGGGWYLVRSLRLAKKKYEERQQEISRELSEMTEILPLVLDRLPIGAMIVNLEGSIVYVNPMFVEIFGWEKEEVQNFYHFYQIAPAQKCDKSLLWEKWETVVTGRRANPYILLENFLFVDKEGQEHPCRVDIHWLGKRLLLTFLDYSEKREVEKASQYKQNQLLLAMKEKDMLFMELEHRVRNTLQLMQSYLRLHTSIAAQYPSQELLMKLILGIDLLAIVQNYTMNDLKLRLYPINIPLLDFVSHLSEELDLEVEVEVESIDMNSQSLLTFLFVVHEVCFYLWYCCKEKGYSCKEKIPISLRLKKDQEVLLRIETFHSLIVREDIFKVSMDFVKELGGSFAYEMSPVFFVEVRIPLSILHSL